MMILARTLPLALLGALASVLCRAEDVHNVAIIGSYLISLF
jgi:prenylcysteine oxidase / farnesylcysteine lyase